jgi:phage baseplate assembly protein V
MDRFQAEETERRLSNLVQFGVVKEVDYSGPFPRARVQIGDLTSGWLRMGTTRAGDAHQSWGYSVGEEVCVAANGGELTQGVIVCALANGANAGDAQPGVSKTVYPGGVVIEISAGAVKITAPAGVRIEGNTQIIGNLSISGSTVGANVIKSNTDVSVGSVSLSSHTHGTSQGPTGGPQ